MQYPFSISFPNLDERKDFKFKVRELAGKRHQDNWEVVKDAIRILEQKMKKEEK
jgi:hypothetical protein